MRFIPSTLVENASTMRRDVVEIKYIVTNEGGSNASLGMRIMLDTVEYTLLWSSGNANIQDTKTADGAAYATGKFDAVTIEYVRFAVTTDLAEGSSSYRPYECELFAAAGGATGGNNPDTGDSTMTLAIALIAVISLGGAFFASRKQFNRYIQPF